MAYGIKIVGVEGQTRQPGVKQPIGQWFAPGSDVEYRDGAGIVKTTIIPQFAIPFDSMAEAWAFWTSVSKKQPTRTDGEPNKPFTAYTVEVLPIPGTEGN